MQEKCVAAGFKVMSNTPFDHHMLYEVEKLETQHEQTEDLD